MLALACSRPRPRLTICSHCSIYLTFRKYLIQSIYRVYSSLCTNYVYSWYYLSLICVQFGSNSGHDMTETLNALAYIFHRLAFLPFEQLCKLDCMCWIYIVHVHVHVRTCTYLLYAAMNDGFMENTKFKELTYMYVLFSINYMYHSKG